MAALLKKRAVAEFTQVIQEELQPKPNKLRLVQKAKSQELDLYAAKTPQDTYNALVTFSTNLPIDDVYIAQSAVRTLVEHFYKQQEAHIKTKIVSLLGTLCKSPDIDATMLADDLLTMFKSEESAKVVTQLLKTFCIVGNIVKNDIKLHKHFVDLAIQKLKSGKHAVRCQALQLIGSLGHPTMKLQSEFGDLFKLLQSFTLDQDPRVRTSAFSAIENFHSREIKLDVGIYEHVCKALSDDYEGVRIAAIKLIWILSKTYPDHVIEMSEIGEELKIADDSFANICNMINDLSVTVRIQAASLLGTMTNVSARFLEQTLDKKLMSNMRRKKSAHERQKELYMTGEWSSGQKWADDAPKEVVEADTVSLMSSGACGAFVHGLEDEYLEVRQASINSLCLLACQSATFAQLSQDFLVDMFNDEIEGIRLSAINSLRKFGHQLELREDQLESILGCLKDFSYDIREALRDMFCQTRLATKECLHQTVMSLLDNLKRYPQDRLSIWQCMQAIGRNHPSITLALVPEFLSTHPYFDTPEPDIDDPAYISVLLLVFNAAVQSPSMISMFPEHTCRHYEYLRNSLPHMVPQLMLPGEVIELPDHKISTNKLSSSEFLKDTLQRLEIANNLDNESVQQLLEMVVRDLERISEVDPSLQATTECTAMFLQCQLLLSQVSSFTGRLGAIPDTDRTECVLNKIFLLTSQLQFLFNGLSAAELSTVDQLRLRGLAVQIVAFSNKRQLLCSKFLQKLEFIQDHTNENNITPDAFVQTLLRKVNQLDPDNVDAFLEVLKNALSHRQHFGIALSQQIDRCKVTVNEPIENTDNPMKFTAGLTLAIPVNVTLENLTDTDTIKIQVLYPNKRKQLFKPRKEEFRNIGENKYKMQSDVIISHSVWIEPCCVEISVIMCGNKNGKADTLEETNLDLCKPIKVLVAPKPIKKFL